MNVLWWSAGATVLIMVFLYLWLEVARRNRQHLQQRQWVYGLGEVVYRDTEDAPLLRTVYPVICGTQEAEIVLKGKPDFILRDSTGGLAVVELKSGAQPARLRRSEKLQLAAYLVLAEREYDVRPVAGYLRYLDADGAMHRLQYNDGLRQQLDQALREMVEISGGRSPEERPEDNGSCRTCWVAACRKNRNPKKKQQRPL